MSRRLILRPEAEADLREAYIWYEQQRPGLGDSLLRAVEDCLAGIRRHPMLHPAVHKEARRALTRRFPYGIFYTLGPTTITVIAIWHSSREPREWQARANGPPAQ